MSETSTATPLGPELPPPGTLLANKYRIERVIGEGGMCVVYQAYRIHLADRVAIKMLRPEMAGNPQLIERFLREGRAVGRLQNDHVVRVLDGGAVEGSMPYLVFEYLEGCDLEAMLEAQGALPISVAVDYVLQACEAIQEAHNVGIIHRDLKPANLFLARCRDRQTRIKVLDFGISKLLTTLGQTQDAALTAESAMLGSPRYMAPEQMRHNHCVDGRTDIWGLGAILYELITNRTPFLGATLPELCAQILRDEPPAAHKLRPECPEGLARIIARCLTKAPSGRFNEVAELVDALAPHASPAGQAIVARIGSGFRPESPSCPGVVVSAVLDQLHAEEAPPTAAPRAPRRTRAARYFAAMAGVAALSVVGFVSAQGSDVPASTYAHASARLATPALSIRETPPPAPVETTAMPEINAAPAMAPVPVVSAPVLKRPTAIVPALVPAIGTASAQAPVVAQPPVVAPPPPPPAAEFAEFGLRK